jgi:hypothetical protein
MSGDRIDTVRFERQKDIEASMADILSMSGPDRPKAIAAVMREALRRDQSGSFATGAALAGTCPHAPAIGAGTVDLILGQRASIVAVPIVWGCN